MGGEILVCGEGEASSLPDKAILEVSVEAEGESRQRAYDLAAAASAAVDAVLGRFSSAIARTTTAGLVVQPLTRWQDGEAIRTGWRAARSSVLEVEGFDQLSDLLAELAEAGAMLLGLRWELAASNPAHGEARRRAAEDARARAVAYASALGLSVGPVLWIAEPGMRSGTPPTQPVYRALAAPAAATDAGASPIEVTPAEMTLRSSVQVAFAIGSSAES